MAEVRILSTRRLIVPDGPRAGKTDALVFYTVDGGAADFVRLPEESATEDKVRAAIAERVKQVAALRGRTFTV
jgi:hypothetical protein